MLPGHASDHFSTAASRDWHIEAVRRIDTDFNRSADTHLVKLDLPAFPEFDLYFKDESTHTTGSLKHRLARSLFLYGFCNGRIREGTTIIEASSGSTAVSEAYFAQLLGLPFVAVMPRSTSPEKIAQIEFYHGRCHLVDGADQVGEVSKRLAIETGGHFMDQFTYAERATDWRGNNNIAVSILEQLSKERYPEPAWIVCGAGTGGTSATIGRYIRYTRHRTRICVVDPEDSVFYDFFRSGNCNLRITEGSKIEGIGRPCVEASFIPEVVDRMIKVPDAASIAAIRVLESLLGRRCGGSTGTNLYGTFGLMQEMREQGVTGSLVTLICDSGARYRSTYFDDGWLAQQGFRIEPYVEQIKRFVEDGIWNPVDDFQAQGEGARNVSL